MAGAELRGGGRTVRLQAGSGRRGQPALHRGHSGRDLALDQGAGRRGGRPAGQRVCFSPGRGGSCRGLDPALSIRGPADLPRGPPAAHHSGLARPESHGRRGRHPGAARPDGRGQAPDTRSCGRGTARRRWSSREGAHVALAAKGLGPHHPRARVADRVGPGDRPRRGDTDGDRGRDPGRVSVPREASARFRPRRRACWCSSTDRGVWGQETRPRRATWLDRWRCCCRRASPSTLSSSTGWPRCSFRSPDRRPSRRSAPWTARWGWAACATGPICRWPSGGRSNLAALDQEEGLAPAYWVVITDGALPDQDTPDTLGEAVARLRPDRVEVAMLILREEGDDPVSPDARRALAEVPARLGGVLRELSAGSAVGAATAILNDLRGSGDIVNPVVSMTGLAATLRPATDRGSRRRRRPSLDPDRWTHREPGHGAGSARRHACSPLGTGGRPRRRMGAGAAASSAPDRLGEDRSGRGGSDRPPDGAGRRRRDSCNGARWRRTWSGVLWATPFCRVHGPVT